MTTFIILAITLLVGFAGGLWVGLKNADSGKVKKTKELLDEIAGR